MIHTDIQRAGEILKKVKSAGFEKAEVVIEVSDMSEMQIDAGDISLMRNTEGIELTVRGIDGGRYAAMKLNQLDDASLKAGLEKLREAVQSAPVDEARAFAPKQSLSPVKYGPQEPELDAMYSRVNNFVTTVGKKFPILNLEQSALQFNCSRMIRVNTEGLELDETGGYYSLMAMFSSKEGEKMSSFNFAGAVSRDLDAELLNWGSADRLMSNSVKEVAHVPFEGKFKGSIILTPDCVFDLMGTWFSHLRDDRLIAGTSQLRDKIGTAVASPALTIRVEPHGKEFSVHEHSTPDGYKSEASTIVENGVLKTYMLSDYGSRKTGLPRAVNSGYNRVIDAGKSSLDEMIGATTQGLLMGRSSGGSPAANGDFSGVAKNSFLIENGKVTKPVSEVMISGNAFEMMNSISAISRERVNDGGTLTPWVKVEGLTLSGGQS